MRIVGIVVVMITLALVFVKRDSLFTKGSSNDNIDEDIIDDNDD